MCSLTKDWAWLTKTIEIGGLDTCKILGDKECVGCPLFYLKMDIYIYIYLMSMAFNNIANKSVLRGNDIIHFVDWKARVNWTIPPAATHLFFPVFGFSLIFNFEYVCLTLDVSWDFQQRSRSSRTVQFFAYCNSFTRHLMWDKLLSLWIVHLLFCKHTICSHDQINLCRFRLCLLQIMWVIV